MSDDANLPAPQGQFLIYADSATQLQVRLEGKTVWLTQKLIAELYGVSVKTVNEHLVNIYGDAELPPEATTWNFRIVQREGSRGQADVAASRDLCTDRIATDAGRGPGVSRGRIAAGVRRGH